MLRDGVLLFQRSPEDRVRFAIKAIRDCQDGFFRREQFTRRRIENLKARKVDREIFSRRLEALVGYLEKLRAFLDAEVSWALGKLSAS